MPPELSVIIPAYNAPTFLARCLDSLARSAFSDYECLVVDDASTDDTAAVAERHGARVLRLDRNGGPGRARNRGAEQARGAILVFLDADVCVHPDTLSRIATHFRDSPATDAVMGSYDDTPADPSFVSQFKNLFHHYVHHQSRTQAWTFWAGCGAMRREVFSTFGGFDESYTRPCIEDIELGSRLYAAGHRIDLNPTIQVTHLKRWTLTGLVRTDIRDRGVPWFLLMLRNRSMPADLNVTLAHRVSVALVALLLCAGALIAVTPLLTSTFPILPLTCGAIVSAGGVLLFLNRDVYRFFARKRGLVFAAGAVPLHWLYYAYCGLSVGLGLAVYARDRLTQRRGVAVSSSHV